MKKNYDYNKDLQPYAKKLRKSMTKSEACMWKYCLSGRQMIGYQFRRQRPIEKYIVDFVCLPLKLIIEVDGYTHKTEEAKKRDIERDSALSSLDYTVLRFSSWEVLNAIVDVQICIGDWIKENGIFTPPGSRQRGKRT